MANRLEPEDMPAGRKVRVAQSCWVARNTYLRVGVCGSSDGSVIKEGLDGGIVPGFRVSGNDIVVAL